MLADPLPELGEPGLVDVHGQDPGPQPGEREGARAAQAARSRDEHRTVAHTQPVIHPRSLQYLTICGSTP